MYQRSREREEANHMGEHTSHGHTRVIRIDDAVYGRLQELGSGFETPNSVIRQAIGLDHGRAEPDGRGPCEICQQERVTTRQRVRFEDGVDAMVDICEQCLADGIADGIVVLITDHQN
jgi:hypothetical protein